MKKFLHRYSPALTLLAGELVLALLLPATGKAAFAVSGNYLVQMLSFLPPIFVLLGLLDVWVERETMIQLTGKGSGVRGTLLAFLLGSAAAGPLYAAFPVAAVMAKKGTSRFNILVFLGAWSTTKLPLLTFEAASLGNTFMLLRLAINIPGILLLAWLTDRFSGKEKAE